MRRVWKAACVAAGVEISLYEGTKHSRAIDLLRQGVSERVLQALLGHRDARSTRRYARFADEALVDAIRPRCGSSVHPPRNRPKKYLKTREVMVDPDAKYSNRRGAAIRGGAGRDLGAARLPGHRLESPSTARAWLGRPGGRPGSASPTRRSPRRFVGFERPLAAERRPAGAAPLPSLFNPGHTSSAQDYTR